jgi:hypothetical protein
MKYTTFIAAGDNHGDLFDEDTFLAIQEFIRSEKPTERIHMGDCFEFSSLRKGVSNENNESRASLKDDISAGLDFINMYRPTVFHKGNHDDRLELVISNSTNTHLREYCEDLKFGINKELRALGCKKILPYHAELGVHRMGMITTVHGYTASDRSVQEHATHYAQPGGACLMGHLHRFEDVNAKKHGGAVGFSTACCMRIHDAHYAKNHLNTSKWANGFLYGVVEGNSYKVLKAHKFNGQWIWTEKFKVWNSKKPKSK